MEINLLAIAAATVAMFVVGAVWYMGLFAKKWGEMHGMDNYTEKEMKEMSAKMGPYYALQLVMTVLSAVALAYLVQLLPDVTPVWLAFVVWAGFVLPMVVSGVVFGGTEAKYMLPKITIQAIEALLRLVVAAWVISLF